MWEVGHSKEQTHWHCCFFSTSSFFFVFFFCNFAHKWPKMLRWSLCTTAHEHIWTRFTWANNCGFVVYSRNDLSQRLRSSLGTVLHVYIQCSTGLLSLCGTEPTLCFSYLYRHSFVCVFGYGETGLFREQADGRFSLVVTAEVVLWLGGFAPNWYSLRFGFKCLVVQK